MDHILLPFTQCYLRQNNSDLRRALLTFIIALFEPCGAKLFSLGGCSYWQCFSSIFITATWDRTWIWRGKSLSLVLLYVHTHTHDVYVHINKHVYIHDPIHTSTTGVHRASIPECGDAWRFSLSGNELVIAVLSVLTVNSFEQ